MMPHARRSIAVSACASCLLFIAAGCATVEEVQRPGGDTEHVISCSYFNWNYCYERARQLCPDGYKVLSESEGYRPKELRVTCTSAGSEKRLHPQQAGDRLGVGDAAVADHRDGF